ncbi:MAG: hypothetical protein LBC73_09655 [Oscillospiraceae bacterium]|jgi:rubrerythrin|nr:hypothetical protein [Oscillospiraceae bacterium]
MTIGEKVAYLKGLAEGMDTNTTENGKLLLAIIDTLNDIAAEIEEINENALDIGEELDALCDDLADVEEFLEELDDEDWDDEDWGFDDDDWDDDDWGDEDDDDGYFACEMCGKHTTDFSIDVNCPECNAEIELDEKDIEAEKVKCHACGKDIELEIDEVDIDLDDEDDDDHSEGAEHSD